MTGLIELDTEQGPGSSKHDNVPGVMSEPVCDTPHFPTLPKQDPSRGSSADPLPLKYLAISRLMGMLERLGVQLC